MPPNPYFNKITYKTLSSLESQKQENGVMMTSAAHHSFVHDAQRVRKKLKFRQDSLMSYSYTADANSIMNYKNSHSNNFNPLKMSPEYSRAVVYGIYVL